MKKTVIIAAAGMGSRLHAGKPKCLVEVGGHAIFEYQMHAVEWADEVRMVVGYQAEAVVQRVSAQFPKVIFVHNEKYAETGLRQSYYLGAQGVNGKALFLDGDTIIGKTASSLLYSACAADDEFIAVVKAVTANPIYAGVEKGNVIWFSYERPSKYELANAAFLSANKLENINSLFYLQLEKNLPMKAVRIDSLEIDTPADFSNAEKTVNSDPLDYCFWR